MVKVKEEENLGGKLLSIFSQFADGNAVGDDSVLIKCGLSPHEVADHGFNISLPWLCPLERNKKLILKELSKVRPTRLSNSQSRAC